MGKELRRYQNRMITCGIGIIGFGFWAMVKSTAAFMTADISAFSDLIESGITMTLIHVVGVILMLVIYSFMMALYGYIGLRAIAIGKGKKPGVIHIIITTVVFLSSLSDIRSTLKTIVEKYSPATGQTTITNFDVNMASLVVSITFSLVLAEMLYSVFKVKKLMIDNSELGGVA